MQFRHKLFDYDAKFASDLLQTYIKNAFSALLQKTSANKELALKRRNNKFGSYIRQINNIDLSSEVSTVHKFEYTDEALLLVRQ